MATPVPADDFKNVRRVSICPSRAETGQAALRGLRLQVRAEAPVNAPEAGCLPV
jgi:hypothetical protein